MAQSHTFAVVGSNGIIKAEPSVIHFPITRTGASLLRSIALINVSGKSTRLHVLGPTTAFFRLAVGQGKGTIAPGISQVVQVEFLPQEMKYYYDTIKIHCEVIVI